MKSVLARVSFVLGLFLLATGCTSAPTSNAPRGAHVECDVPLSPYAAYQQTRAVFAAMVSERETRRTQMTWVSLQGSEPTVETREDGSEDRFFEKGEFAADFLDGRELVIELRRDDGAQDVTRVRVFVFEPAASASEGARASEVLQRVRDACGAAGGK
ncbi:MAG: hypothetical protein IPJ77_10555 [Planctomycetes bacterium]|nr:hypothetical protein [Planctomycetota bacterium]